MRGAGRRIRGVGWLGLAFMAGSLGAQSIIDGVLQGVPPPPAQPGDETWTFVNDLKQPLWAENHAWPQRAAEAGEADLSRGARVIQGFPDPEGVLETAVDDLRAFLAAGRVLPDGPYVIETGRIETPVFESYRIEVEPNRCRILAADTEGVRRGIVYVEDRMLAAEGPFLPLGSVTRKPFIASRISRCFFGPIKRPPRYRDELMDDVDYYPEAYLNRLAHEGINGLWLTVTFRDLCRTEITPGFGEQADRRFAKLRRTVERCRRYGIRIYLFAIEPAAWDADDPVLKNHPELGGAKAGGKLMFCPSSETAQRYLYEAAKGIFSAVPHLGGLINITHGERYTSCQSVVVATSNGRTTCPVCAKKEPWEIFQATLEPLSRGMREANPHAELIAWFYMPQDADPGKWVYAIPQHGLSNVVYQFNFESGVTKTDFGRVRLGGDYWISTPGPSARFERLADLARESGVAFSAKIQTGCSHEVATVPFVPVPGLLYRKFRAMRELGVSRVMLCWYFGNYPGIMNKAAGELAFEPFPETEQAFVSELARAEWGRARAGTVAQAWERFAEGYGHYPLVTPFQYWGPMHDGVVWPLLLLPQDAPLAPTWLIAANRGERVGDPFPPSGDRIAEALGGAYTLQEAIEACRAMSVMWDQGVGLLRTLERDSGLPKARRQDIGVSRALGLQFRSGLNILRFYDLRERLARETVKARQLALLSEMRGIVEKEAAGGVELKELCRADSRIGFHSEAEGYKYFPAKIAWRGEQLRRVLDTEMPALERSFAEGKDVFAAYAGRQPEGPCARSVFRADIARQIEEGSAWLKEQDWQMDSTTNTFRWTCRHDRDALYLLFTCDNTPSAKRADGTVSLILEPRRLWPSMTCRVSADGKAHSSPDVMGAHYAFQSGVRREEGGWSGWMRIPFVSIGIPSERPAPVRINVVRVAAGSRDEQAWITRRPWPYRLRVSGGNPADLGWLLFDGP
ncbi:MAG TPA: hypothetical protein P5125_05025 [Kiritimatiellia bacterium]|nr:hypothetical protein [Kiritimatiellia bacterium]HPC48759.1 hypothetical protein [Kiritimatiellia bacterium]HPW74413.1 hypothetical protein [Kiritimatiellia bacterium]HRU19702.1 hypothetical protein [Kiritimatiellia bacterium]